MTAYQLLGYPLILLGIFQMVLAVICFSKGASNRAAVICGFTVLFSSVYSVSAGATYLLANEGLDYSLTYRNCWIGWITAPGILHLLLHFGGLERYNKYTVYPLYVFWTIVWILCLSTSWIDIAPASLIPYQEIEAPWEVVIRSFAIIQLIGIVALVFKVYRNITGIRRTKLQYLLLGFVGNGTAAILTSAVFQIAGTVPFDPALTSYFGILLSAPLFYSMTRYRLFDIRFVLSRLFLAAVLTICFGSLHYLMLSFFMTILTFKLSILVSGLIAGFVLFLSPVLDYARAWSLRLFNRTIHPSTLLKELSTVVISTSNPDDLFRRFGDLLRDSLALKSICFYSANEDDFVLKHCAGEELSYFDNELRFLTGGALSRILIDRREVFVRDEHITENLSSSTEDNSGLEAELDLFAVDDVLVPLAARGSVVGIMALGPKANSSGYTTEELAILETAGSQMGLALENAKLFEQAVGDGLTNLYHQKYFKARLEAELLRARRHGGRFGVLLIDVDHFKSINDTLGHVVGDGVLQTIASIMKSTFRAEDVLARYGGEEFGVLLIESHPDHAFDVADRFRMAIEKFVFQQNLQVTVSIGLFVFDGRRDGSSLNVNDLLVRADQALYRAKKGGRNQVVAHVEQVQSAVIPDSGN